MRPQCIRNRNVYFMSTKSEQQQQLAKRNTIITKQIVLTSPVYAVDIQY